MEFRKTNKICGPDVDAWKPRPLHFVDLTPQTCISMSHNYPTVIHKAVIGCHLFKICTRSPGNDSIILVCSIYGSATNYTPHQSWLGSESVVAKKGRSKLDFKSSLQTPTSRGADTNWPREHHLGVLIAAHFWFSRYSARSSSSNFILM